MKISWQDTVCQRVNLLIVDLMMSFPLTCLLFFNSLGYIDVSKGKENIYVE